MFILGLRHSSPVETKSESCHSVRRAGPEALGSLLCTGTWRISERREMEKEENINAVSVLEEQQLAHQVRQSRQGWARNGTKVQEEGLVSNAAS